MTVPGHVDTNALLSDLATQYERSCFVLSQIEHSLKGRDDAAPASVGPGLAAEVSAASVSGHLERFDTADEFQDESGNMTVVTTDRLPRLSGQPLGFDQMPPDTTSCCDDDNDDDYDSLPMTPSRSRVSFIDMSSVAPPSPPASQRRLPRRTSSLLSMGGAALQPSNRRATLDTARTHQQQQQQQQQPRSSGDVASSRNSFTNLGPAAAIMARLNSDYLGRGPRQPSAGGGDSPKSPSLPDINVQPLRLFSRSQSQQVLQPSDGPSLRLAQELQDNFLGLDTGSSPGAPAEPPPPPPPQQQQPQPLPAPDGFARRRSISRRGSDYVFSPLSGSSFNAAQLQLQIPSQQQQQQQQPQSQQQGLGSPAGRSAASPVRGHSSSSLPMVAIPAVPAAGASCGGGFGSRSMRPSSSNTALTGLRASSRSQGLPLFVLGDDLPDGGGAVISDAPSVEQAFFENDDEATVAVGVGSGGSATGLPLAPSSAAVGGGDGGSPSPRAGGGGLPVVRLRRPPARAFSHSVLGSGSQQGLVSWPQAGGARVTAATAAVVTAAGAHRRLATLKSTSGKDMRGGGSLLGDC